MIETISAIDGVMRTILAMLPGQSCTIRYLGNSWKRTMRSASCRSGKAAKKATSNASHSKRLARISRNTSTSALIWLSSAKRRAGEQLNQGGGRRTQQADGQHSDHDVRIVDDGIGVPREVADSVLAADDLARQEREPRHAHADCETGADARQRSRQHDVAEDA